MNSLSFGLDCFVGVKLVSKRYGYQLRHQHCVGNTSCIVHNNLWCGKIWKTVHAKTFKYKLKTSSEFYSNSFLSWSDRIEYSLNKTYVEPVNLIRFRVQISNLQLTKVFKFNLTRNFLKPKRIDYHLHS